MSLQIGHRISVDIVLFTQKSFNEQEYLQYLEKKHGFSLQYMQPNTLKGFINGIFVDLIKHDYKVVRKPVEEEGIILSSKADIAAMKVNAISGNGSRAKDFVDIYFLLKEFSFKEIISFYTEKYDARNEFHAVKSLTYFEDIVESDWPNMVRKEKLTLEQVKKEIIYKRDEYLDQELELR